MAIVQGTSSNNTLNGSLTDDSIYGYAGHDVLFGLDGNDKIIGGTGNDSLTGGSGNDSFIYDFRGFGADTILDFTVGDTIDLSDFGVADLATLSPYMSQIGADVQINLVWSGSVERITVSNATLASITASSFAFNTAIDPLIVEGTSSGDVLFGGNGADQIFGGSSGDDLNGGAGNDILVGGTHNDLLRGGLGNDVFRYDSRGFDIDTIADFTVGDKIDLRGFNIGNITSLAPYMSQVGLDVQLNFVWSGGTERIIIANTQLASLTAGSFVFNTSVDPLTVSGNFGVDVLFGGNGADKLFGGNGNDQLNGGLGNDTLVGGVNNDLLRGGLGNDVFRYDSRGFDIDTIADFTVGDKIDLRGFNIANLTSLAPYMSQVGLDVHLNFVWSGGTERIIIANTQLASLTAGSFVFNTSADPLTVDGNFGIDVLFGGNGADKLFGYNSNDDLNGGSGNDTLVGGANNDLLRGGLGNDVFRYDGRGFDIDTIADFTVGDKIDLRGFNIADIGTLAPYMSQVGLDVQLNFIWSGGTERIIIANTQLASLTASSFVFNTSTDPLIVSGNFGVDVLFGGNGADKLFGGNGNDQLNGGLGNDTMVGGAGADSLRGGLGADRFSYSANDTSGIDQILDFSTVQGDKIDLRAIDPSLDAGNQALTFVSGAFTDVGQVRIAQIGLSYQVQVNLDTNFTTSDLTINVSSATPLTVIDLLL